MAYMRRERRSRGGFKGRGWGKGVGGRGVRPFAKVMGHPLAPVRIWCSHSQIGRCDARRGVYL